MTKTCRMQMMISSVITTTATCSIQAETKKRKPTEIIASSARRVAAKRETSGCHCGTRQVYSTCMLLLLRIETIALHYCGSVLNYCCRLLLL